MNQRQMMRKNVLRNEKGFTLIEIIAVLIILGILAAVAVPKYVDMQTTAKQSAAQGQVAEVKSALSQAYAKAFLTLGTGAPPTTAQVITNANLTDGTTALFGQGTDSWNVSVSAFTDNKTINITVEDRAGDEAYNNTGTWVIPF